ncbi:fumarylacetoacetase [Xylaria bambusicola]|uniref:fumarylacetoacetase n=1 Tax=Xylaria bambusicola TaxID=326684 RepID=UPI002008D107|nr:fumarylacetoacetase [Xylaria bambusicola]KAI0514417.1 fumarylacetoacetase [Xylaria bambusicola]
MAYAEHFSIANIPYGIASDESHSKSVATRLENKVFFLVDLDLNYSPGIQAAVWQPTLNMLAAKSKDELRLLRADIQRCLSEKDNVAKYGKKIDSVTLHLPIDVRGFTDYSCSREHNENASTALFGKCMVPESFPHSPMGYSGRPSSIVVSGTQIRRPCGVYKVGDKVEYGVCQQLDYELEMACIVGKPSQLGEHVQLKDADDHIFGLVLLNDWSARDIQGFEMLPLGPLNGKSFGTSISPWVVTLEALEPFEASPSHRVEPVTAFLQDVKEKPNYNITLEASILSKGHTTKVCKANISWMYWTFRDLVAQQTVNGCNVNTGDVLATGTVSGKGDDEHGCLLEMTRGGKVEFTLSDGQKRTYLQDGDSVRMTGFAGPGVGFGDCSGLIVPARPL